MRLWYDRLRSLGMQLIAVGILVGCVRFIGVDSLSPWAPISVGAIVGAGNALSWWWRPSP